MEWIDNTFCKGIINVCFKPLFINVYLLFINCRFYSKVIGFDNGQILNLIKSMLTSILVLFVYPN